MTPAGKLILYRHEGDVPHAYEDSKGYLTIGVGHLIDKRKGGGLSQKIRNILFDDDIADAEALCAGAFNFWHRLDPVRRDVLAMLCFSMGLGNAKNKTGLKSFTLMLEAIDEQDWHKAAFELYNSDWRIDVGPERSRILCDALEKGTWTQPPVTHHPV